MIENPIQRGKSTYQRDKIVFIFEPEEQKELNIRIVEEFKNKYFLALRKGDIIFDKPYDTNIGVHEGFSILINKYSIDTGCFRDGWHIKVSQGIRKNQISVKDREKIFGDVNRSFMWTQETEKVADMMGELYKEIMKL